MRIEWDNEKREATLKERGLDFADVAHLDWETALTAEYDRYDYGEARQVTLGLINDRLCVVVWIIRGGALRVISMRKANAREVRRYEEQG